MPTGACIVERFDLRSNRLTDRLVYAGSDLVHEERVVSAHTKENTTFTYDEGHRLVEKTLCLNAGAGEPEWHPSWRPPMAVYDEPLTAQTRTVIFYEGDTRSPRFARIDSSSGEDGYRMKLCYAYDAAGQRARRFQTFRTQVEAALQVQVRSYTRKGGQLSAIETKNLALKGRALAGQTNSRVDFLYDEARRLTGYRTGEYTTRLRYDERGRFVAFAGTTFESDDAGRLQRFHAGDPALDGRFEWDASGRIERASFESGDGYRVTYAPTCAAGFSPPPVTPSVEGYLFYEGKDEL
ncbi:MAG: hypothetical protein Q8N23_12125 [Archangium sp.]|nr:hypothetical protein [Archangium sp.]MDP3573427.1 hypothetical protein [Archangium sp.]